MIRIEPVPGPMVPEALQFIAGGTRRDALVESQARYVEQTIRARNAQAVRLWWARRWRGPVAAAVVLENPGRTGMLLHSAWQSPGVDGEALIELLRGIGEDAIQGGLSLVQSLQSPQDQADAQALTAAGYQRLAELIYMKRDLVLPIWREKPELTWRRYDQFTLPELMDVIAATYRQSLDCPALSGVRELSDVIEGHRATGVFQPQTWWIVDREGSPAGCILVNDSAGGDSAEAVYLGVVPAHRGHGLARDMLRRAAAHSYGRGLKSLTLATDAQNVYARRIYESEGFGQTLRRLAYAMLRAKK